MKYRVSFEIESPNSVTSWDWCMLLKDVDNCNTPIDWDTITFERQAGWEKLSIFDEE